MSFKHSYFYAVFWQNLKRNRLALAGGCVVGLLFAVSLLAPLLVPYDPNGINAWQVLSPPSWHHWFGTDELGRDVLSRVIYGARISLKVGFVAVGIAVAIGTLVGLVSGYYRGIVEGELWGHPSCSDFLILSTWKPDPTDFFCQLGSLTPLIFSDHSGSY